MTAMLGRALGVRSWARALSARWRLAPVRRPAPPLTLAARARPLPSAARPAAAQVVLRPPPARVAD
ncbi:hypothetical protein, partial [Sphaerisporangium rhizosphaerae]